MAESRGRRRVWRGAVVGLVLATLAGVSGAAPPTAAAEGTPPQIDIVGGTESPRGSWPSQVALVYRGATAAAGQFCGGTVIARTWILTAAHCVTDADGRQVGPTTFDVLVGTQDLRSGGTRIPVATVRRHPAYDDRWLRSDVAVVGLDRPVPSGTPIQALAAPGTDPAAGTDTVAVGWGDLGNETFPARLREVTVQVQSPASCADVNGPQFQAATMLCAWRGGAGVCFGDSGGPLLVSRAGTWVQVGITSWGWEPCGRYDDMYARVSVLGGWVRQQTRYGPHPDSAAFVSQQHRDLLGRAPTPTELYSGAIALNDGQDPAAYVAGLLARPAFDDRAGSVVRLYRAVFLRRPDTAGLAFWIGELDRGASRQRIANQMVAARELRDRYGTLDDTAFVELVYRNVLSRVPDATESGFWVGQLRSGWTRGRVMIGFSQSREYKDLTAGETATIAAWSGLVRRVPTEAEIVTWRGRPAGEVAGFLIGSYGYAARF